MYKINDKDYECPVDITLDIFNDKWKLSVIWHLMDNPKRFKELDETICGITKKTLTVKLKELEEKNIINREVFAEVPPKVEYSLTPIGDKLKPVLKEMYKWGINYVEDFGVVTEQESCEAEACLKNNF